MLVGLGTVRILRDSLLEKIGGGLVVAPLHRSAALIEQGRLRARNGAHCRHEDR